MPGVTQQDNGVGRPDVTMLDEVDRSQGMGKVEKIEQDVAAPRLSRFLGVLPVAPVGGPNLADQAYARLKQDPRHPSLHFKKVGRFWAARLGAHCRALAVAGRPSAAPTAQPHSVPVIMPMTTKTGSVPGQIWAKAMGCDQRS